MESHFLSMISKLEHTIKIEHGQEIGLVLKQVGEWALVTKSPNKDVRVGDALAAIDGRSVLLHSYDETFASLRNARMSSTGFTITFRRAPFHRGWMYKKSRNQSGRGRYYSRWKLRYFVLAYGSLAYYDKEPKRGGIQKGYFMLPSAKIFKDEGDLSVVTLVKGSDKLALKNAPRDMERWTALLHIAIAHAEGGSDLLKAEERRRLEEAKQQDNLLQEENTHDYYGHISPSYGDGDNQDATVML